MAEGVADQPGRGLACKQTEVAIWVTLPSNRGLSIEKVAESFVLGLPADERITEATFRTELKAVYSRLGIHKRNELNAVVDDALNRNDPVLSPQGISNITHRVLRTLGDPLFARLEKAAADHPGIVGLTQGMRTALPLDEVTRTEWDHRFQWLRHNTNPFALHVHEGMRERFISFGMAHVTRLQDRGEIRRELNPQEIAWVLMTYIMTWAPQIMTYPSRAGEALATIDAYVDSLRLRR